MIDAWPMLWASTANQQIAQNETTPYPLAPCLGCPQLTNKGMYCPVCTLYREMSGVAPYQARWPNSILWRPDDGS